VFGLQLVRALPAHVEALFAQVCEMDLQEIVGKDPAAPYKRRVHPAARLFVQSELLTNVVVEKDDLFDTRLPLRAFDLLHARFQMAPLGRAPQQLASYLRLLKAGGWIVLEDPDMSSWKVTPSAPAVEKLIALIRDGFIAGGGNFDAGLALPGLLYRVGLRPHIEAAVVALEPGHPYLRLPIQFTHCGPGLKQGRRPRNWTC